AKFKMKRIARRDDPLYLLVETRQILRMDDLAEAIEAAGHLAQRVAEEPLHVARIGDLVREGVPVEEHLPAGADRRVVTIGPLDALHFLLLPVAEIAHDGRDKLDFSIRSRMRKHELGNGNLVPVAMQQRCLAFPKAV